MTNKDLPPIRLSPRTGIEIDLRVSRLSLLVPWPPPVNAEEECWCCNGCGRGCWDCCITCWRRSAEDCCCCAVTPLVGCEELRCGNVEVWRVVLPDAEAAEWIFPYDWRWRTPSMLFISCTSKVRHKHSAFSLFGPQCDTVDDTPILLLKNFVAKNFGLPFFSSYSYVNEYSSSIHL